MTVVATIVCWVCAVALVYVYAGYPVLLCLAAVFRNRRRPDLGYVPKITVLIAAHNEEAGIRAKIEQTLALDYPAECFDVLVVSDGSTDGTDDIVRSMQHPRVRLLRTRERRGKTNAQNEAVPHCTGEVIVFSDATTIYHPLALRYLAANYVDPKVGAVSGRYQYFDPVGGSPTGVGTIAFWNYENFIKALQSKISTISGCCGCIYSVRAPLYTVLPEDVISDLVQPLWVIKQGYRVVFEDRALAYEETTTSSKQEFRMRVRVVTRGVQGILSVPDILNPLRRPWIAFQLLSHKVLRWLVPLFLVGLFVSTALLAFVSPYRWLLAAELVFYAWALLTAAIPALTRWRALTIPLYFCTLNAAAMVSLIEVLRGRKYVVWQPVRPAAEKAKTV